MDTTARINDYNEVRECDFKGEHYSVRDNGAIFRHAHPGKRLRKYDNVWTFGKPNEANGYMFISLVRVHQIVATAFFGERDTKVYVVDHKDTNRRNNRVSNLHWLTRLENVLSNPVTRKKIIMCCGSLEAFLQNPAMIRKFANRNPEFGWMRAVSKKEAERTLKNMNEWAHRPIEESHGGKMGDWIYKSLGFNPQMEIMNELLQKNQHQHRRHVHIPMADHRLKDVEKSNIIAAKSPSCAVQKDWITPTDFPLCPQKITDNAIIDYYCNLSRGEVLTTNMYGETRILEFAINEEKTNLWVLCKRTEKNPIKPWILAGIYLDDDKIVHENLHSFFDEKGGYKYFTLAQGKEWTGGDCFDDYC